MQPSVSGSAPQAALARARTLLFVPGNRPERFDKALRSGADAVVFDLEDAVPAAAKAAAREAIAAAWPALREAGVPLVLRINALDQAAGSEDQAWLAALLGRGAPAGVIVPKAESAAALCAFGERFAGVALLPLIESAAGHAAVQQIAAQPRVLRLLAGHIDFMADTGLQCSDDEVELAPLRFALAMATRLQRLAPAVDGVTAAVDDAEALRRDTQRALRFGFGGKLCIHPRQVAVVHEAMAPSAAEIDWARRVIAADAAAGGAAVQLDGRMVDAPVVLQARRTLARAGGA
ncbi:MAG TPA: CoA ester lyase [Rubrivivax sp.]|nr:CoA ester lyase [Rubrivivax sp.]